MYYVLPYLHSNCCFQVDLQICLIKLESWAHLDDQLTVQWRKDDINISESNYAMSQHDLQIELASNVGGLYSAFNGEYYPFHI